MRACCPADWLPLCCLCQLHAAAVWSLCSVAPIVFFVCFFFVLFCCGVGFARPGCFVSAQQHLSVSATSCCPSGAFCPRVSVSRYVFRNKCANTSQLVHFSARFLCECCLPSKQSPFHSLTLSLCCWMSCSSPGCLPLIKKTKLSWSATLDDFWTQS